MTDRELLELAAKAAGYTFTYGKEWWDEYELQVHGVRWNPLADDGDALRLAVKLGICITVDLDRGAETEAWAYAFFGGGVEEDHRDDPYAATRRAIVRAAAEIGKTKHE
jgi:hypothetical protein